MHVFCRAEVFHSHFYWHLFCVSFHFSYKIVFIGKKLGLCNFLLLMFVFSAQECGQCWLPFVTEGIRKRITHTGHNIACHLRVLQRLHIHLDWQVMCSFLASERNGIHTWIGTWNVFALLEHVSDFASVRRSCPFNRRFCSITWSTTL